jgi:hypothetical protein
MIAATVYLVVWFGAMDGDTRRLLTVQATPSVAMCEAMQLEAIKIDGVVVTECTIDTRKIAVVLTAGKCTPSEESPGFANYICTGKMP